MAKFEFENEQIERLRRENAEILTERDGWARKFDERQAKLNDLQTMLAAAEAELDIAKDVIKQERLTRNKLKRRAAIDDVKTEVKT